MHLGDLVKFVEKHKDGIVKEVVGLVIEKKGTKEEPEKPIFRVKWFKKETPDSWHISPNESEYVKDLYIISSAGDAK